MDLGTLGTWVGAVIALVPALAAAQRSWPGLTADDRRRRRIQEDVQLMRALPNSAVRDQLSEAIEAATSAMLSERRRDRRIEQAWTAGSVGWFVTWVLLVVVSALPTGAAWTGVAKPSLSVFVVIALTFSLVCFVVASGLAVGKAWHWLESRRLARRNVGEVSDDSGE